MKNVMMVLFVILFVLPLAAQTDKNDPVVLTFSAIGDSRQEPGDPRLTEQDAVWLQETKVLTRLYREIQGAGAQALFFSGDMIMGYSTDANALNRQYAYWRGITAPLFETGTYVVPVPGNHEVQEKFKDQDGKTQKVAREGNEKLWRENMGDLIVSPQRFKESAHWDVQNFQKDNHPEMGSADKITTDQTQLSFSFDVGTVHFVALNTDPVGNDSHAPAVWLESDLGKASTRGAKLFFVFGHKPAYTYYYNEKVKPVGLDTDLPARDAFWKVIEKYKAIYVCGHEHIYHAVQPNKDKGGKSWQIIAGTAGSPFEAGPGESKNPNDRKYIWTKIQVKKSGKIHFAAYGFDDNFGPSQLVEEFDLN